MKKNVYTKAGELVSRNQAAKTVRAYRWFGCKLKTIKVRSSHAICICYDHGEGVEFILK